LISVIIFCEEYRLWSWSLCSFVQPPITTSFSAVPWCSHWMLFFHNVISSSKSKAKAKITAVLEASLKIYLYWLKILLLPHITVANKVNENIMRKYYDGGKKNLSQDFDEYIFQVPNIWRSVFFFFLVQRVCMDVPLISK
jgi:hypothetical protein